MDLEADNGLESFRARHLASRGESVMSPPRGSYGPTDRSDRDSPWASRSLPWEPPPSSAWFRRAWWPAGGWRCCVCGRCPMPATSFSGHRRRARPISPPSSSVRPTETGAAGARRHRPWRRSQRSADASSGAPVGLLLGTALCGPGPVARPAAATATATRTSSPTPTARSGLAAVVLAAGGSDADSAAPFADASWVAVLRGRWRLRRRRAGASARSSSPLAASSGVIPVSRGPSSRAKSRRRRPLSTLASCTFTRLPRVMARPCSHPSTCGTARRRCSSRRRATRRAPGPRRKNGRARRRSRTRARR